MSIKPHKDLRIIIGGGGTGGHLFPALAIGQYLRDHFGAEVLFAGALGKMEMTRVPELGFEIVGLDIRGFNRSNMLKNLALPFKILKAVRKAGRMIRDFRPLVVVGVGGYSSGPVLYAAQQQKIPTLIQEQNSFPGITNKMLGKKAATICAGFEGLEKYFDQRKIVVTGNPVRQSIADNKGKPDAFHDEVNVLVMGGSLGSRTLNESIIGNLEKLRSAKLKLTWQTGNYYWKEMQERTKGMLNGSIAMMPFIDNMDEVYQKSDIVVSRAGALSISELSLLGKPTILVPSPNVAEDHQTKNARSLEMKNAAILITDAEAREKLADAIIALANDKNKRSELKQNIAKLGKPDATKRIAEEIMRLAKGI
ncbi:MAG: undecaprenyldiphospho-muramoylpentapeptide beta-N-acetylglucosaminyltransferase [Bacteroidia bacterium]